MLFDPPPPKKKKKKTHQKQTNKQSINPYYGNSRSLEVYAFKVWNKLCYSKKKRIHVFCYPRPAVQSVGLSVTVHV